MGLAIVWFRNDLRLNDNPALLAAGNKRPILPIFIFDTFYPKQHTMGRASKWWLHHSLKSLNNSLNASLKCFSGNPLEVLLSIIEAADVSSIFWNRCYEPWSMSRDKIIKATLIEMGMEVKTFNGSLLWEPWNIKKEDGSPYKVFTPFFKKGCLSAPAPRKPIPVSPGLQIFEYKKSESSVEDLKLLSKSDWSSKFLPHWNIGEKNAYYNLVKFLEDRLKGYKLGRNFPAQNNVSRLSPHIHFGELSPNQVWHAIFTENNNHDAQCFCSELGWREFSNYLLFNNLDLPTHNLQKKFDKFSWRDDKYHFDCWKMGATGIPIIDAGMRELWQTGYMHNRVRMLVGSFLVKNLRIHWRTGAHWFWDCLVDADLANNSASWQWVAGTGADAAPYFRIFNPVTQAIKFDPEGAYIYTYVPELKKLPVPYLYCPWEADSEILKDSDVLLGINYPNPIIDLKVSREVALKEFKAISNKNI